MTLSLSSSFISFQFVSSWFEPWRYMLPSFFPFMMLRRTSINDLVPKQVQSFVASKLEGFLSSKCQANSQQVSVKINRFCDENIGPGNELCYAAHEYLSSRITRTYKALEVGKLVNSKKLEFAVDRSQEVVDEFEGTKFTWMFDKDSDEKDSPNFHNQMKHSIVLTFNEKYREKVMNRYIPHMLRTYEAMKAEQKIIKIYSWFNYWHENELSHPATFDTLALDPETKQAIIHDLDRFLKRKELYQKVGKPWKRGYLLHGPPGTGKTSLIAAIANYLKFNVYDLQITSIFCISDLRQAMRDTSNRSIIVIEDIGCNKEIHARLNDSNYGVHEDVKDERLIVSSLLNYVDDLWTNCGEERIIIFTTDHNEKIDPELLRPGRMDMHIHLSFLKAKAFRILASNYLNIQDHHPLFEQIEELLEKIEVTPAVE